MISYKYRIVETLCHGRFIKPHEFAWLMQYFKDRLDPRRLCLAVMMTTGIRTHECVYMKVHDLLEDSTVVKVPQCKARFKPWNGIVTMDLKYQEMPIPSWLTSDLRDYVKLRLQYGYYNDSRGLTGRLFPTLRKVNLRAFMTKLRERYSDKQPWLRDVWKRYKYFDADRNLVRTRVFHRVGLHGTRAYFITSAYDVVNKDLIATKAISGHEQVKTLELYTRAFDIMEKKILLKNRHMERLQNVQACSISKDQRRLVDY